MLYSWFYVALRLRSECMLLQASGSKDNLAEALKLAEQALLVIIQSWPQADNTFVCLNKMKCNVPVFLNF